MNNFFNSETCVLCKLNDELGFLVKEVMLFRGISEYINQLVKNADLEIITNMFAIHADMSATLKNYFVTKFSPSYSGDDRKERLKELEAELDTFQHGELSSIIIAVFKNIVRTNYFLDKESIAFKIEIKKFKDLLEGLQPNYEIFVYHPEFMGVHLRMTRVSRGGLRWSERDDFREEIRSLMITQDGKNSIIVPAGAKGGFVIANSRENITKEMFVDFYSKFIHNLLDLVDNRVDDEVTSNQNIIHYDTEDTYFVVAADKGTANMSDVANSISLSRNFWLGDAFASGGSNGYSHKDLGITAKGAFVSTERFFKEKGLNFYEEPISVIGIGSMNGDVFGNGILLSNKFKLVGAFSHREIFIDPNPDCETSYQERRRLFNSDNGGAWSQYKRELISKGGGVWEKRDENIPVSEEMKTLFEIEDEFISGDDLIKKMLTAKVDLLFNGGVGTYVKSSTETNDEVGDRGNNNLRVDGKNLRAFAVCEGGNLGFTQKARVEYSLNGGKVNLDGIDNSAGVNTSDHEVNIKILLSRLALADDEKRKALKSATNEVVKLVLQSNFDQALGLSIDEERYKKLGSDDFKKVVQLLESELAQFKRNYFAIPNDENFNLSRPNLSFLFSYSKILINKILLRGKDENDLLQTFYASEYILDYFPKSLQSYRNEILSHPLQREIMATVIADRVINYCGVTLLTKLSQFGEDGFRDLIGRYLRVDKIVNGDKIRSELDKKGSYSEFIKFENELLRIEESLRDFSQNNFK